MGVPAGLGDLHATANVPRAGPGPRSPGLGPGRRPLGILYLFRLQVKRGLFSYFLIFLI